MRTITRQGGAEAACQAHNLEVAGAIPAPGPFPCRLLGAGSASGLTGSTPAGERKDLRLCRSATDPVSLRPSTARLWAKAARDLTALRIGAIYTAPCGSGLARRNLTAHRQGAVTWRMWRCRWIRAAAPVCGNEQTVSTSSSSSVGEALQLHPILRKEARQLPPAAWSHFWDWRCLPGRPHSGRQASHACLGSSPRTASTEVRSDT